MILIISGKYGIVKRQFHLESRKGKRKIQFKHLYSSLPESDFSALRPGKRHAPQKALPRLLRREMPVPISAHDMSSFQLGFLQNGDSPVMLEIFGIQNTLPQSSPRQFRAPVFIADPLVIESAGTSEHITVDIGFRITELPYGKSCMFRHPVPADV